MRFSVVAAITSGLLLGVAYQFSGVLGFIAYVPLLVAMAKHETVGRWRTIALLYITFFLYHAIANWWICSWQERTDPYLFASGIALAIGHPFFLMLPFVFLSSVRKRAGAAAMFLAAPLFITGFEWLHGQTDASYPWLSIGYMLTQTPWGQLAEFVGVYGLTLLLAVVNSAVAWWVLHRSTIRRPLVVPASLAIVLLGLAVLGLVRGQSFRNLDTKNSFTVTIVQPNLDPWDKWMSGWGNVLSHERVVDSLRIVKPNEDLGLIVWPETAIPYSIRRSLYKNEWNALRSWVDTSGKALLTGFADYVVYPKGEAPASARRSVLTPDLRYDTFNAAVIVPARQPIGDSADRASRGGQAIGHSTRDVNSDSDMVSNVHRKSMLTPFAERLPFADQLSFAMSWIEWGVGISAWGKGATRLPLHYTDSVNIGTIICIESIYPEVARDMVLNGANVLCVITNDAWYNGTWGPQQHYNIARMRAIEQRRPLIRCAMSGVSGLINPDGTSDTAILAQCTPQTRGAITTTVTPRNTETFYARFGQPWAPVALILSLLAFITTRFPSVIRKMRVRFTSKP